MDYRRSQDTLKDGRSALNELERQLKMNQKLSSGRAPSAPPLRLGRERELERRKENDNYANQNGSKFVEKYRFSSERQSLDKISRTTRLNSRKDAPLGSLEELDDRGLIVGGSIPSTYSSSPIRQRARRQHEMKNRSSRLQDREENVSC